MLLPALLLLVGPGAWLGLPRVLRPFEIAVRKVGTELNDLPGYVQMKHSFEGLQSDDWISLDEGSWFPHANFLSRSQF